MSRLIEKLKQYESSLTINEVIKKLENEEQDRIKIEEDEFKLVKELYKNVYLKRIDEKSIFGKKLEVFNILDVVKKSKTTDWENVYYVKATKISFSDRMVGIHDMNGEDANCSFSTKELSKMSQITENKYMEYLKEYNTITNRLKSLIK